MTYEEYRTLERKYSVADIDAKPSLESIILLQDAAFRAFIGAPGFENIWEQELQARIRRQATFAQLPRDAS